MTKRNLLAKAGYTRQLLALLGAALRSLQGAKASKASLLGDTLRSYLASLCAASNARTLLRRSSLTSELSALAPASSFCFSGRGGEEEVAAADFFSSTRAALLERLALRLRLRLVLLRRLYAPSVCEALREGLFERLRLLSFGLRSRLALLSRLPPPRPLEREREREPVVFGVWVFGC